MHLLDKLRAGAPEALDAQRRTVARGYYLQGLRDIPGTPVSDVNNAAYLAGINRHPFPEGTPLPAYQPRYEGSPDVVASAAVDAAQAIANAPELT